MFIRLNNGTLSEKRWQGDYNKLRDDEVALIEGIVHGDFEG